MKIDRKNESDDDTDILNEIPNDVGFINDTKAFREKCSRRKKPCLISFLDGRTNLNSMRQFDSNFKELDKFILQKKSSKLSLSWVNGTCQVNYFNIRLVLLKNLKCRLSFYLTR